jgi:hypothetical protein
MLQPLCTPGRILFGSAPGPLWLRLQPVPEAAQAARLFAIGKLGGEDEEFVSDVETVTSELVTNSIRYALEHGEPAPGVAPGIWLGLQPLQPFCRLYVRDPYPAPPIRRVAADTDTSGRGLLIVELLTAAYWVETRKYDKTSHAIVAKPGVLLPAAEIERLRWS